MFDTKIYLENGMYFEAKGFGASGTKIGEIVFNTGMSGYQEITTDPSYAGQFIVFTMPEIGVVGANIDDMESKIPHCSGIIVSHYVDKYSNFRGTQSFEDFLIENDIMGIASAPTRELVQLLVQEGSMMMVATSENLSKDELAKILKTSPNISEVNYIEKVSIPTTASHTTGVYDIGSFSFPTTSKRYDKTVVAIDFGAKNNILNELFSAGMNVEVMNNNFSADELIARFKSGEIDGVFLSNGPGDPKILVNEVSNIKKLIAAKIPIFGICLGHQLLSIAHGFDTYKLKFGHHGSNHPVKNMQTGEISITAQNHIYSVPEEIASIATVTHRNLFDGTIEGLRYNNSPIFSVQYHPEASPGPRESTILFKQFRELLG